MFHKLCKACIVERDLSLRALDMNEVRDNRALGWKSTFDREGYRGLGELRREMKEKRMVEHLKIDPSWRGENDQPRGPTFSSAVDL